MPPNFSVLFIVHKKDNKEELTIKRTEKFGGNINYDGYEKLEKDYLNKKLHPMDLKNAVAEEVNKLLEPIRQKMKGKEDLIKKAFP